MSNEKPHIIKEISVFVLLSFIILVFLLSQLPFLNYLYSDFSAEVLSSVLVDLANKDRVENDLQPLYSNSLLKEAAEKKVQDMIDNGYFAHFSPTGEKPWDWISDSGYEYIAAGENLAVGFFESENVERAWMDSPTHKDNILNQKYTDIGIATGKGFYQGAETIFVVQMFGKPKAESLVLASPSETVESVEVSQPISEISETEVLGESIEKTGTIAKTFASPRRAGSVILIALGVLLLGFIGYLLFDGLHKHHPKQIIYAGILLLVIAGFVWANQTMIFSEVIVL